MEKVESRKQLKKRAKTAVKKHYWLYLTICLIAGIIGAECSNSLTLFNQEINDNHLISNKNAVRSDSELESDTDTDTDTDTDIDTDTNTDIDIDTDTDLEENADSQSDTYTDVDADGIDDKYDTDIMSEITNSNILGGIKFSDERVNQALNEVLVGDVEKGNQISNQIKQENIDGTTGTEALGRSRGVLAHVINNITSGKYIVTVLTAVYTISRSQSITKILFILLSLFAVFLYWFYVQNMYIVISRRIFLEGRVYEKIPFNKFLIFYKIRKWTKVSWTMFVTTVFLFLWMLTIVGGVIKAYSYSLVPYIVAENPNIGALQAITLSRKMMKGHKWERFVLQLSFILWNILGIFTLGLSDLFYLNSYRIATYAEYFYDLRRIAKYKDIPGVDKLNDYLLYEKANQHLLDRTYADELGRINQPVTEIALTGFKGFIARNFGITLFAKKDQQEYEKYQTEQIKLREAKDIIHGLAYPKRLFTIPEHERKNKVDMLYYMRNYSVWSLICMFFTFAIFGWLWEVALHFITSGEFVNRGALHGPWLPIYGTGGILILTLLKRFRKNAIIEFFMTVLLCGCVEYFMGYYLEVTHNGLRWWDYSGYFLNLHGRICAEGLLCFGLGGIAIVYVIAPMLDNVFRKIPLLYVLPICIVLLLAYLFDQIYSAKYPNVGTGVTTVIEDEILHSNHSDIYISLEQSNQTIKYLAKY